MISVYRETTRGFLFPMSRTECMECLQLMLATMNLGNAHLEVVLGDDAAMARLNQEHMGVPGPTNVLSFPMKDEGPDPFSQDPELEASMESIGDVADDILDSEVDSDEAIVMEEDAASAPVLGSLVLSLDTVRRESLLYGQDIRVHFLTLMAHGLAHLAGQDHGELMDMAVDRAVKAARPVFFPDE